ncbi:hypothetical protein SDC9_75305 [bioreactor metagenome]|uniref:Permease of phosphate ABC transporter n=1 Tax=bioreactor metagenome TaxID=1076179 RepID=A0A644YKE5_9ZZZZ|nr:permease of phosphate ABC transporter [Oscillibacter sp.]
MKKLFSAADRYLRACDWRDIAVLKFCLCALGVLVGLAIPTQRKKPAARIAGLVFAVTYVPLLVKFLFALRGKEDNE